jgi:hypothetical protein
MLMQMEKRSATDVYEIGRVWVKFKTGGKIERALNEDRFAGTALHWSG